MAVSNKVSTGAPGHGVIAKRGGSSCIHFSHRYHNTTTITNCIDGSNCPGKSICHVGGGLGRTQSVASSRVVLVWLFILLTNLSAKAATDPVVGGHHGGIIEKQTQLLQQHQPTIGITHQQEDEPFLLNEIEEDVHCK